jgi:phosphoglycolate phosphatase
VKLFFDLDGTLTDPGVGIVRCIRHALAAFGRDEYTETRLRACVGPPLADSFRALLQTEDEAAVRRAVALYRERFGAVGLYENVVYDDVPELLRDLRARGRELYVVTSKPHVYARRIVRHFGLDGWFSEVYGSELDGTRVHKHELIRWVLDRHGLRPGEACMIGDRGQDVAGARANGVYAIGVLWGYGSRDELAAAGADALVEKARELPAAAPRLPA